MKTKINKNIFAAAFCFFSFLFFLDAQFASADEYNCCITKDGCMEIGSSLTVNDCTSRYSGHPVSQECGSLSGCTGDSTKFASCISKCDTDYSITDAAGRRACKEKCAAGTNTDPSSPTSPSSGGGNFSYTPMEEIPGFGRPTSFPEYLLTVYKFLLWSIGVAALLMISVGAFMYITSAGNNAAMGKAKGIITDAIAGVILALVSWVILYTINPALVTFRSIGQLEGAANQQYADSGGKEYPQIDADMPKNCTAQEWQDLFKQVSTDTGVDKCILQAVAAKESGCNKVPNRTGPGNGDCSVVQIRAQANCGTSCDELEKNPAKALACAAKYLKSCEGKVRNSPEEQKIRDIYAGYNGGCGALRPSKSCAGQTNNFGNGYLAWDCPKDCGGLCKTVGFTATFWSLYQKCKQGG